jgi:transcriptional regulator with XRE-family HTH domain
MLSDVAGERIAEVRREQRMTREQLADECKRLGLPKLTTAAIVNLETGRKRNGDRRREITIDELVVIATALRIPPVLLVYPLGRRKVSELIAGQQGDPWIGARWFTGEDYPPGIQGADLDEQTRYEYELRMLPLRLRRNQAPIS